MILFPRIHNNGSDGYTLLGYVSSAIASLRQSIAQLQKTEPHARDYYVIGENAYADALHEYAERFAKMTSVLKELEHIQECILDQIESRAKR